MIMQGEIESAKIKQAALETLKGLEVEYFVIVDKHLQEIPKIQKKFHTHFGSSKSRGGSLIG